MSSRAARQVEYAIIGLGVLALWLIFQPFSLALFGVGCALVVVAGLINNLLPLCQPGVPRTLVRAAIIVRLIFCVVLLVSISAAISTACSSSSPSRLTTAAVLRAAFRMGSGGCRRSACRCGRYAGADRTRSELIPFVSI